MNNIQQLLQQMQTQMSAQMQNDPLTKALDKIVNGAPSTLFAKMIDKGPLGLPLDPMLTNFPSKARNILETNYPVSNMNREQYRELEGEAGTLDQVHAVLTMSIERIDRTLNSPQAMAMSPVERQYLIQQRQELTAYQAAAGSMSEAIRQQLAQRRDLNYQQGMGYNAAGVPIVGGSGTSGGWRSVGTPNPNANSVRRTTSPRTQSTGSSRQFVR